MIDLISREGALAAIDNEREILIEEGRLGAEHVVVHHARRLIEDLPSVIASVDESQIINGMWIEKEVSDAVIDEWQSARCSVCKKYHTTPYMYYFDNYNYCPNCGAKMGGSRWEVNNED